MFCFDDLPLTRLAAVAALLIALGVTGCGRKAGLDPPPGAAGLTQEPQQRTGLASPFGGTPSAPANSAGVNSEGQAIAPPGQKRRIPLDVLLD